MRPTRGTRWIAACAAGGVLVAGCSSTPDETGQDGATASATSEPAADEIPVRPSGRLVFTAWEERHPGGLVVGLRSIEVDEHGNVAIEFEATSMAARVGLAETDTFLEDDLGNQYELVPPASPEDESLPLDQDQRVLARLSFQGPIAAEATRVMLAFNGSNGRPREKDEGPPRGVIPGLVIRDIPLPGVGLDAEAVGTGPDRDSVTESTAVDIDLSGESQGVTVRATRVEFDGTVVYVDVSVEVPAEHDRPVRINSAHPRLEDSAGGFAVAENIEVANEDLVNVDMEPGSTAQIRVAFRHPFADDATHFDLRFNRAPSTKAVPEILIENIPIPGRETDEPAGDE